MKDDLRIIHAEPQKEFFINMLTRDIGLLDCVLDLIDNSIHNLIRIHKTDIMPIISGGKRHEIPRGAKIDIDVGATRFRIRDTCGGIPRKTAREEIFLFGRRTPEKGVPGLGLYGVGMKRAFFKLGRNIRMVSRVKEDIFQVTIDVEKWKDDRENWTFSFDPDPPLHTLKQDGTFIEIWNLNPEIGKRFATSAIQGELRRRISNAYMLFINNGLPIILNKEGVESEFPAFETKRFVPARKSLHIDNVDILIIAGLAPKESRTPHGWYIFCNGRMILKADKSELTGWGDRFPQFHSKYNHFIGQVYFSGSELDKLPWDTTKSRVETDSTVYQAALQEMKIQARPILDTLNKFYPSEAEEEEVIRKELLQETRAVTVDKLPKRDSAFMVRPVRMKPTDVNILYKRPKTEVERVKKAMGDMLASNRKVGEHTFEYFLNRECS